MLRIVNSLTNINIAAIVLVSCSLVVEYEKRLVVFRNNLKEIAVLQETEEGTATYGVNEFSDISSKMQSHGCINVIVNYLCVSLGIRRRVPVSPCNAEWMGRVRG